MAIITTEWRGTEYFPLTDIAYVEFLVGNAKQAAYFYRSAFGFHPVAYSGPETGSTDSVSYVMKQNNIVFIVTTPLKPTLPATNWLKKHGDGVYDIALQSENAMAAFLSCLNRGAVSAAPRIDYTGKDGQYIRYSIKTYGDTIHSFVQNKDYQGIWAPGFESIDIPPVSSEDLHLITIDHIVGNVEENRMNQWEKYYERVFGFTTFVVFNENDISTQYSALKSRVVRSKNWKIKFPINEPAKGLKKSQIQEYLDFNHGAGVQHIALLTDDIVMTVKALRKNGVEFLHVPDAYYDELPARVGEISEILDELKPLKILVDRDEEGYLLQLFTKPIQDRPTLFFEIIQRKGARGFGQGNFQALFESIELEQAKRGNL